MSTKDDALEITHAPSEESEDPNAKLLRREDPALDFSAYQTKISTEKIRELGEPFFDLVSAGATFEDQLARLQCGMYALGVAAANLGVIFAMEAKIPEAVPAFWDGYCKERARMLRGGAPVQ